MRFEKISYEQWKKDASYISTDENVKKFCEDINLPKRATKYSAGYDFYAPVAFLLEAGQTIKIPTGIRAILDDDKFLAIYPRSGLGFKYKIQLFNTIGVIDADYSSSDNEGHIWVKLYNDSPEGKELCINQGDAICQGIIQQFFKTEDDNTDGVRNGGFGSTGK